LPVQSCQEWFAKVWLPVVWEFYHTVDPERVDKPKHVGSDSIILLQHDEHLGMVKRVVCLGKIKVDMVERPVATVKGELHLQSGFESYHTGAA